MTFDIEIFSFENDPEQCLINVINRDDRNVKSDIKLLSKKYNPIGTILSVYKGG